MPPGARYCPFCASPLHASDQETAFLEPDAAATGAVAPSTPRTAEPRPASRPRSHSSSGLGSSGVNHGRFEPGTILADRYRIVARLGQGGMGEVYRADDLRLGQPVALKFLPATLERDPVRLAQFHNEVRLARQIAHKNICRMYDVGEADGLPFLTMEYVDGEDLSTLLRRIGRLPQDKALDIARQLGAGVAAAHERGVLHRDLKPANVMIDGQGHVRITDFGLAAIAGEVEHVQVGTPAYMAPEQLAGKGVSVQSDLYALGLVLYEVFTGRRAYTAASVGELVRQHDESSITLPTAIVRDLDPVIERAIMRCLERDPALRPRSALAVAASLPGGDPLAAALAAGETPSPEMVAAAGERQAASMATVAGWASLVVATVIAAVALLAQQQISNRMPLDLPPAVLVDRAEQALAALGYTEAAADTRSGFYPDGDYFRHVREESTAVGGPDPFATRPFGLRFYYRTSPRRLVPNNPMADVTANDPPLTISGMTIMSMDPAGRLDGFSAIPPQRTQAAAQPPPATDWDVLFRLAGLDRARFTPAPPEWLPRGHADARMAWTGTLAERPEAPVRLEAASWQGRVAHFQIVWPWTRADRMQEAPVTPGRRLLSAVNVAVYFLLLAAAAIVSWRNVRAGRGDHRGAIRLATVAVAGQMITWIFNDSHIADPQVEVDRLFSSIAEALFSGGLLYVMYLALEPAVRRYWPDSLLGWSRLLRGRILDARVGRDVLAGTGAGALMVLVIALRWPMQSALGYDGPTGGLANVRVFEGPGYVAGLFASLAGFQATFNAMWCVFAIVGLKRLLKRLWLVAAVSIPFFTVVAASSLYTAVPGFLWLHVAAAAIVVAVIVAITLRVGLLATVGAFLTTFWLTSMPWTLNASRWDFPALAFAFALLLAIIGFGAVAARSESRD